jgi:hypothetical protein
MILFKELNVGIIAHLALFCLFHKLVRKTHPLVDLALLINKLRRVGKRLGMPLVCVLHWNRVWVARLLLAHVDKVRWVISGTFSGFLLVE